jgi:hypothetical protein
MLLYRMANDIKPPGGSGQSADRPRRRMADGLRERRGLLRVGPQSVRSVLPLGSQHEDKFRPARSLFAAKRLRECVGQHFRLTER